MEQLLLSCRALSSPTLCRFIPALSQRPSDLTDKKWIQIFRKKLETVKFPVKERNKLVVRAQEVYDAWSGAREKEGLPGQEILEYYLRKREKITGK